MATQRQTTRACPADCKRFPANAGALHTHATDQTVVTICLHTGVVLSAQAAADVLAMASLEVDLSGIQEGEVRQQQRNKQQQLPLHKQRSTQDTQAALTSATMHQTLVVCWHHSA